jgi:hypothetical protein
LEGDMRMSAGELHGMNRVRHMLAWAVDLHRAESFYRDDILYWAVPRVSSVRLLDSALGEPEEDPASACHHSIARLTCGLRPAGG